MDRDQCGDCRLRVGDIDCVSFFLCFFGVYGGMGLHDLTISGCQNFDEDNFWKYDWSISFIPVYMLDLPANLRFR